MIPETINILPPEPNSIVSFGIGAIAVVVAGIWIGVFSRGNRRHAVILSSVVALVMAFSAFATWGELTWHLRN